VERYFPLRETRAKAPGGKCRAAEGLKGRQNEIGMGGENSLPSFSKLRVVKQQTRDWICS
jgi:hypothetical protein